MKEIKESFIKKKFNWTKINSGLQRITLQTLVILLTPLLLYTSTQMYYFISNTEFKKKLYLPTHLLGLLIVIMIFVMFSSILKSNKRACILLSSVIFIFLIINQIKIYYALDPVMFSDIYFLQDTGSLLEITGSTLLTMLLKILPASVIYAMLLVLICMLTSFFEMEISNKKLRLLGGLTSFFLLLIIYYPNDNVTKFMQNHVFDKVTSQNNNHTTTNIAYYQKHGVISGMYGLLLSNRFIEPDLYSDVKDEINTIMKNDGDAYCEYIDKEFTSWGQPNIIMIFSESFWDVDKQNEVKFNRPITSNLNKLKQDGIYAEMISPSFGGVSANVEYEVLTGSNLGFFSEGYIPYMQLINNSDYYVAPYVSTFLKENNYKTQLVSTWKSTLFNCQNVYEYMGIDETSYVSDFKNPDEKGGRISEKEIVDRIIDTLNSKPKGQKIFNMSLTAQTHMPYYLDRYDEYDISIESSPLSDTLNGIFQCYAQGVYDADKELGRLYDFIQTYDEPTIIIFYGDHLPYLNTSNGEDVYKELNYFNTDDYLTNCFRKYNTQMLITGNFDLGKDNIDYIGPDLIMPYVFSRCDFEKDNDYFNYLASTIPHLPAFNLFVAVDNQGNLYSPNSLTNKMKEIFDLRQCINWREYIKE